MTSPPATRSESSLGIPGGQAAAATHLRPAIAPALPVSHVAGCRLLEEVAAGGHAVVYRATHERIGRPVAIKALRTDAMAEPGLRARFLREARILGRFAHPNLPQIHDVVEVGGALFLVLEWCGGIDLQDALGLVPQLPWPAALAITVQVARALSHVHARGVLHGDVKPSNLILTQRGLLKLIDFGVAVVPSEERGRSAPRLATPGYLSLASHEGRSEAPDARDDQYALGVVLHQMLYGYRPGGAPLGGTAAPSPAPSALRGLLSRCLEEQPSRRYAELSELIDTGLGLLRSHGPVDEVEQVRRLVALLEQPTA